MFKRKRQPVAMFQAPMASITAIGSLITLAYYTMLGLFPGSFPLLKRYSECHAVAYATVWMFAIAICILSYKFSEVLRQKKLLATSGPPLEEIRIARNDASQTDEHEQMLWLEAAWRAQPAPLFNSWLGKRIRSIIATLLLRKSLDNLEEEQKRAAERDADVQHDSYALVRTLAWAMPMLGFLGTVLGLSTTLGNMDSEALAEGSQTAMNQITSGLYVAFDTTAIALVLTMIVIFLQYVVTKFETSLLGEIDAKSDDLIGFCLVKTKAARDLSNIESALKTVTTGLLESMDKLVKKQSEVWNKSLEKAEERWSQTAIASEEQFRHSLLPAITEALQVLSKPLMEHSEQVAKIHAEGAAGVDSRIHQWQVTISEQSRAIVEQQREIRQQSQLLADLVEKAELVKTIETPLQATLQRMTDVDRFHDAAVCLTEAVAVLGTQMERYGYLGRQPLRRRPDTPSPTEAEPATIPFMRKAG